LPQHVHHRGHLPGTALADGKNVETGAVHVEAEVKRPQGLLLTDRHRQFNDGIGPVKGKGIGIALPVQLIGLQLGDHGLPPQSYTVNKGFVSEALHKNNTSQRIINPEPKNGLKPQPQASSLKQKNDVVCFPET
jgi:hypothetical protein